MVFAGQDHWRRHPMLTGCYRRPFPGLGIAAVVFAGYCVVDGTFKWATAPAPKVKYFEPGMFKYEQEKEDDDDDDE